MRNNIIAIVSISFLTVGLMWAIGNLTTKNENGEGGRTEGLILVAEDNLFNKTNPTIFVQTNETKKLTVINKDFVRHDFVVKDLNINTAYLSTEQKFTTAIASKFNGQYEYYCSFHPELMRGKIIIE